MKRNEHKTTLVNEHVSVTPTSMVDQTLHLQYRFLQYSSNGNEITVPNITSLCVLLYKLKLFKAEYKIIRKALRGSKFSCLLLKLP